MVMKVVLLAAAAALVSAQVPRTFSGYEPTLFERPASSYIMPNMDIDAKIAEADAMQNLTKWYEVGQVNEVSIDLLDDANMVRPGLYVKSFEMGTAKSMAFYFSEFYVEEGAAVWMVGEDGKFIGPFTHESRWDNGDFQTTHVKGNKVQVHYYAKPDTPKSVIKLAGVTTGFRLLGEKFAGTCNIQSVCNDPANTCRAGCQPTDRSCSVQCTYFNQNVNDGQWAGQDWDNERRAGVAVGRNQGSRYCSGSMINNADGKQYMLTAAHCGPSTSDIVQFNFFDPSCTSTSDSNGDTSRTAGNLRTLTRNTRIDNQLVEVGEAIPSSWNVYLAGYEAADESNPAQGVVGIHHPSGANQKISHSTVTVTPDAWVGGGVQDHWRVGFWTEATTEPGSSGSPLYNRDTKRIIGQLHGGSAACPARNGYDTYGAVWAGYQDGMATYLGPRSMDGAELNK